MPPKHTNYVSEFTMFMKGLKETDPTMELKQQAGRALLWDKEPTPLEEQARVTESKLKQQAYVYLADYKTMKQS